MKRILFVCTGNICRSPTAHGVLQHRISQSGLSDTIFAVDSAGIESYHIGDPPDLRTVDVAACRGYDLSGLRARQVRVRDFEDFDMILAMDGSHYAALMRQAPEAMRGKIGFFLDYLPGAPMRDVPDPYYGSRADFEHVLDLIEQGVDGLLTHLGYNQKDG